MGSIHRGHLNVPAAPQRVRAFGASDTWYKRDKLLYIRVRVQGGGGNGVGLAASVPTAASGGAGGYTEKVIAAKDLAMQETVTVGGIAGTSSFGAHCSATGGGSGSGSTNGGGGTGIGGDLIVSGEAGHNSTATGGPIAYSHGGRSSSGSFGCGGSAFADGARVAAEVGLAGIVFVEEFYAP